MKVRRLYELINGHRTSLNDEISFYDNDDNKLELIDIYEDNGKIIVIFEQQSGTTKVEWGTLWVDINLVLFVVVIWTLDKKLLHITTMMKW